MLPFQKKNNIANTAMTTEQDKMSYFNIVCFTVFMLPQIHMNIAEKMHTDVNRNIAISSALQFVCFLNFTLV